MTQTKAEHTAGPWECESFDLAVSKSVTVCDDEWEIAQVFLLHPNGEANARLIAAAPELLEALERILRNGRTMTLTEFDCAAAEAAIRKARGE